MASTASPTGSKPGMATVSASGMFMPLMSVMLGYSAKSSTMELFTLEPVMSVST